MKCYCCEEEMDLNNVGNVFTGPWVLNGNEIVKICQICYSSTISNYNCSLILNKHCSGFNVRCDNCFTENKHIFKRMCKLNKVS